jgi:hypothetical protein
MEARPYGFAKFANRKAGWEGDSWQAFCFYATLEEEQ